MTLPTLINKTQDKEFKTAFKKQYSAFSQAMLQVYMEDGSTYEEVNWTNMPVYICKIQTQMKVVKSGLQCDKIKNMTEENFGTTSEWPNTGKHYWHTDNKWFDKKGNPQGINGGYRLLSYILPDGAIVNYNCYNQIFIDVNGYKKPNVIGRDIFFFRLESKNLIPTIVPSSGQIRPNGCAMGGTNSTPILTKDNIEEDCKSGSGWGCSLLYLLE